jgi:hypothetical protein
MRKSPRIGWIPGLLHVAVAGSEAAHMPDTPVTSVRVAVKVSAEE